MDISDYVCCGLIEKKAIARINIEIHMRMKPIAMIVNTAPISNSNPVVPNKPTPAFIESVLSDFLMNIATIMAVKNRINSTIRIAVRKGVMALRSTILLRSGGELGIDVQSPFHPG